MLPAPIFWITHLYPRLLRCGLIIAPRSDPFRNLLPQLPTFPVTLLINRFHCHLLFWRFRIEKDGAFASSSCRRARPLPLISLDIVRAAGDDRFE